MWNKNKNKIIFFLIETKSWLLFYKIITLNPTIMKMMKLLRKQKKSSYFMWEG